MSEGGAFRGPVTISLAVLAVIGWGFALYVFSEKSKLQTQLTQHTQTSGTLQSLRAEVETLTSDKGRLTEEGEAAGASLSESQEQLALVQQQIASAQDERDHTQSDLDEIEEQLAPLRRELESFDSARAEAEQRLSASTQELASVGERLTGARANEADLQQQLSVLTDEAAQLTVESAEAESRVQEARDAEASLQASLTAATAEFERMTAEQSTMTKEILEMTQHRDLLAADNAAAAEQRQSVQTVVTQLTQDLAARSQQLAEVEQRINDLQLQNASPVTSEVTLKPGTYTAGSLKMTFEDDGQFILRNDTRGEEVTGRYSVNDALLTLVEAQGDIGTNSFPMMCALRQSDEGLVLERSGDGVCPLAGLKIEALE